MPSSQRYSEIIETYGTPAYVYEVEKIRDQYKKIQGCFDTDQLHIHYAMKANSNPQIVNVLRDLGAGIDAVSPGEVALAIASGIDKDKMLFTPSGAPFQDLIDVHRMGIGVTIDNLTQLEQWGKTLDRAPVAIRFNPAIKAGGGEKISVGHSQSKFGIGMNDMQKVKSITEDLHIPVQGIHIHVGSDIYQVEAYSQIVEAFQLLTTEFSKDLKFIDYGGGYKVTYAPNETEWNISPLCRLINDSHKKICAALSKDLIAIIEPGKFLLSESGVFLTEVNVVKESYGKKFAIINSGFNHLIRPMYYNAYHHIINLSNPGGSVHTYDICGYNCEEDTFARARELPEIRVGDNLMFLNAGAYCYSMASHYNTRLKPVEVLCDRDRHFLIRHQE